MWGSYNQVLINQSKRKYTDRKVIKDTFFCHNRAEWDNIGAYSAYATLLPPKYFWTLFLQGKKKIERMKTHFKTHCMSSSELCLTIRHNIKTCLWRQFCLTLDVSCMETYSAYATAPTKIFLNTLQSNSYTIKLVSWHHI